MPENDQTRWIGIRPTDPSEDISTTTKKVLPAIGDLQAVKNNLSLHVYTNNKDCSTHYDLSGHVTPVGEIWVYTSIAMMNKDSMCDMCIRILVDGGIRELDKFYSYEPGIWSVWKGLLLLENPDQLRFRWLLGGVSDDLTTSYSGYKIGVY